MSGYYSELYDNQKTGESKVAWCSSTGPVELLRALGFLVYFPETHAAILGAKRHSTELISSASSIGYSREICSYLTSDIGAFLNKTTPLTEFSNGSDKLPAPDVLVYNTNQCRDVQEWFSFYAGKFDVPILGINSFSGAAEITASHTFSIKRQLEGLVMPLEKISGRSLDMEEFANTIRLSLASSLLWEKVLDTASAVPSPLTFFDSLFLMGPVVVGRGKENVLGCYSLVLEELEERISNGISCIPDERYRIFWEGMPIWGRLKDHSEMFSRFGATVAASTYCSSWIFSNFDPDNPFESMAKAYSEIFIARDADFKENYLKGKMKMFDIHGIIFHNAKTCPSNTNSRYGMPDRLKADTGIPYLVIDGDPNDLTCLSDEQIKTSVEAFIELLEDNRIV